MMRLIWTLEMEFST